MVAHGTAALETENNRPKIRSSALYFDTRQAQARLLNSTENHFSLNRAGSAKPLSVRRGTGRFLAGLLATACSVFLVARADSVYSLTGWVQPAVAPYDRYGQFVVLRDPTDPVRAILHDPQGLLTTNLPARLHILATISQPRGPEDEPVFRVTHAETGNSSFDSETATGTGAPPWADLDGGLFHPAMNVIPRLLSLTDDDADGDRVPDARDVFPGFPDEWRDTDRDGIGENADPDDDNDGMSDNYEVLCGLNPFLADADADADGDGMSNGREALAGTLANDASSLFALSIGFLNGKPNVVRWPVLTTRVYSLEKADSPSGPWHMVLSGLRPPVDAVYNFSIGVAEPAVFVRAIADYP